jgi:hypothetical protein
MPRHFTNQEHTEKAQPIPAGLNIPLVLIQCVTFTKAFRTLLRTGASSIKTFAAMRAIEALYYFDAIPALPFAFIPS